MDDEAESEHSNQQIARAFALLTVKLEDAATLAVEGQAPQAKETRLTLAQQIADLAGESATIAGTLAALLGLQ